MSDLLGSDVATDQPADVNSGELGWRAALKDDLKNNEVLSNYEGPDPLAREFLSLKEKSANALYKPGENATDEEKTAFATSMRELRGVPESVDGYELGKPEGLPDDYPWDEGLNEVFRKSVHKRGISPDEAKGVFEDVNKYNIERYNEVVKSVADNKVAAEAELKKEWAGDAYAANHEKAVRAFKKFGGEDGAKFMKESGLGNNPVMVKMFHSIFEAIGEDTFAGPDGSQNNGEDSELASAKKMFPSMA